MKSIGDALGRPMKTMRILLMFSTAILLSSSAYAQGSIGGTVKDTSGAVLPGVSVEVSSPSLIEKVRSTSTDGSGQYQIVNLRPGSYAVTFTLSGFTTVKREGVELTGSFAAIVDADLRVGALAETVTVTSQAQMVDVQNVVRQRVLTKEIIDTIPTGRSSYDLTVLIPGINSSTQDVGGTGNLGGPFNGLTIHNTRTADSRTLIDGLSISTAENGGQASNSSVDMGSAQEVAIDFAAGTADSAYSGPRVNLIPREGGNKFTGSFFGTRVNSFFQGSNYTQALKSAGLAEPSTIVLLSDFNPSGGGPIKQDTLWFFSSARFQVTNTTVPSVYHNLNAGNPNAWTYMPDFSQVGVAAIDQQSVNTRITWQITPKNKLSLFYDNQWRVWNQEQALVAPESVSYFVFPRNNMATASWTAPLTTRLLFEMRGSNRYEDYSNVGPEGGKYNNLIAVTEQSTGLRYRGAGVIGTAPFQIVRGRIHNVNASVSYVTGAQTVKVGFSDNWGGRYSETPAPPVSYTFNNGIPNQITERATPYFYYETQDAEFGAYAQEKLTLKRLTINAGIRLDIWKTHFPSVTLGPAPLIPNRNLTLPEIEMVDWKDISPRLSAAYDLSGKGTTALKISLGRYAVSQGLIGVYGDQAVPANRLALSVTRTWTDRNQDFNPDCDLTNPLSNGECGTMSNTTFGQPVLSTAYDPAVITGWNTRPYSWEFSTALDQQFGSHVSTNVGFFRRWYGNFAVTDNQALSASDYSSFSITAATDPRLPGGGGQVISGLLNLNPNKVGQVSNLYTSSPDQIEHWNGVDVAVNVRLPRGVLLQGGTSTGRTSTNNCNLLTKIPFANPVGLPICDAPGVFVTQAKFLGSFTVPKVKVQFAATLQSLPGPVIAANYVASNALVAPSLGRPLSGGAANVTINLVPPNTLYGERLNQLDVRLSRTLTYGRTRVGLNLDFYNALNSSAVLTLNNTFSVWQTPTSTIQARFAKISVQLNF